MKYPMINRQPRREVNVPQLSGGLNLRDSLTTIRDNQMTDCVNMWYKNGMLRTRPSFNTSCERLNASGNIDISKTVDTRFHDEIKIFYDGFECVLATNKRTFLDATDAIRCDIDFEFQSAEKIFVMPSICGIPCEDITYFCSEMSGVLYCYVSDYSIWKLEYSKQLQSGEDALGWVKVNKEDAYVPKVYVHCKRSGWDDFEGVQFEGYNLIGNRYKIIYSAYNENDSDKSHPMRYNLPQQLPETGEINVEFTSCVPDSEDVITVEHKITYTKSEYDEFSNGQILVEKFKNGEVPRDGLYLFVKYNYVGFLFEPEFTYEEGIANLEEKFLKKYASIEDNVVITAPYNAKEDDLKKVFAMTRSTWFGGAAYGINGGSRLFLCGNTNENEKSLVVWSELNNPLYFSENCYAYVGSKSRAVTAFCKQGENLVIFKENKIYSTCYQQNTNIDADSLISQAVIDYGANSTYFPMIQINGYIGCDCPDTIQMCRNRLVWATSEGKVYTLYTINQYNEHTVYELSDMIMPKLKEYKNRLKTATSVDFDGHYILFLDDCAFVMDYCSYGYQYVYSYSKNEDANVLIPWYFWEFDFLKRKSEGNGYKSACVCGLDGMMLLRAHFDASSKEKSAFVGFTMNEKEYSGADSVYYNDVENNLLQIKNSSINCNLATKMFELGGGVYNASVDTVVVKLGSNDARNAVIHLFSEQGEEMMTIRDNQTHNDVTSMNFIRGKVLHPSVRNIIQFGMKFECDGQLCIEGLSIKYRLLGGVK